MGPEPDQARLGEIGPVVAHRAAFLPFPLSSQQPLSWTRTDVPFSQGLFFLTSLHMPQSQCPWKTHSQVIAMIPGH